MTIDPSELDITSLPWLPLEVSAAFPRQACIYFAIASDDSIQYIGRTVNPKARWAKHHKFEELSQIGNIWIAYLFVDESLLKQVEAALIKWFKPPLNKIGVCKPSRGNPRSIQIEFEVSVEDLERLKALAKREGRQESEVHRAAWEDGLNLYCQNLCKKMAAIKSLEEWESKSK